jgi:putative MATE family efflux protein
MSVPRNNHSDRLGSEGVGSLLFRLSVPSIVGMTALATYNLVDAIFIGRFVGPLGLAGLTVVFPVQMLVNGLGIMLGIGGSSVVSRALGAQDSERAEQCLGNLLSFCLLASTCIIVPALIFHRSLLETFGATPKTLPYAADYMRIVVAGGTFQILAIMLNNQVRAQGDARTSMFIMLLGCGSNIVLDALFVPVLGWGVRGAAAATVIGQAIMCVLLLGYFHSARSALKLRLQNLKLNFPLTGEALAVGFPTFARQAGGSLMLIIANRALRAQDGATALAVFGIINRLMMFMFMPLIGIVQGVRPILGYNFGAGQIDRMRRAVFHGIRVLTGVSLVFFVVLQVFPQQLFSVFSTDAEVVELGRQAIRIFVIGVPTIGFQVMTGTMFQAMGRPKPALFITMGRQFLFLIPLLFILPRFLGHNGIWVSFPIADCVGAILAFILFKIEMNRIETFGNGKKSGDSNPSKCKNEQQG